MGLLPVPRAPPGPLSLVIRLTRSANLFSISIFAPQDVYWGKGSHKAGTLTHEWSLSKKNIKVIEENMRTFEIPSFSKEGL